MVARKCPRSERISLRTSIMCDSVQVRETAALFYGRGGASCDATCRESYLKFASICVV